MDRDGIGDVDRSLFDMCSEEEDGDGDQIPLLIGTEGCEATA